MKRKRRWPTKVLVRRAKLIQLWHNDPKIWTKPCKRLGDRLNVSRWTIWRDIKFLVNHDCLELHCEAYWPYNPIETPKDLLKRFKKAHELK